MRDDRLIAGEGVPAQVGDLWYSAEHDEVYRIKAIITTPAMDFEVLDLQHPEKGWSPTGHGLAAFRVGVAPFAPNGSVLIQRNGKPT